MNLEAELLSNNVENVQLESVNLVEINKIKDNNPSKDEVEIKDMTNDTNNIQNDKIKDNVHIDDLLFDSFYNDSNANLSASDKYKKYYAINERMEVYKNTEFLLKENGMSNLANFIVLENQHNLIIKTLLFTCLICSLFIFYSFWNKSIKIT